MKTLTIAEFIDLLKRKQGKRTQRELADDLGVSAAYLCDVFMGRRVPADAICEQLGYERRVYFVKR